MPLPCLEPGALVCNLRIMSLPNLRVVARIKPNDTTETGPDHTVDSHLRLCLPFHTELRTQPSTDRHLLGLQSFLGPELPV